MAKSYMRMLLLSEKDLPKAPFIAYLYLNYNFYKFLHENLILLFALPLS
jgi:hypothetical protein